MPSWQSRLWTLVARLRFRRREWGDTAAIARRARRLFGAPSMLGAWACRGLRCEPVNGMPVRGEWLMPDDALPGVVLYVHGGGFVAGSMTSHRPITAALARRCHRRVFSVEYRLAPEHPLPAAHDDVTAAYEWLLSTGTQASQIAVVGDSAGGNLALGLVVRLRDARRPLPGSVVLFSPWVDLSGSNPSVRTNDGRCAMFRPGNIAGFAAAALGNASARNPSLSPQFAELGALPPVLVHVGSTELLLDDAREVHRRIQVAGGESHLRIFDDVVHCWQMMVPFVPEASESIVDAAAFLSRHFGVDE